MPIVQRFVTKANGAMILAGNSLNCRQSAAYPTGTTVDYLNGSYISTNNSLIAAGGFPSGTTFNPVQSSSSAFVNIPSGSTILYAQLFWQIFFSPNAVPNQDNPITFITPVTTANVSPDLSIKQILSSQPTVWQAQDVKALVQNGGSGFYQVANVPGQTVINNSSFIGNGWGLIIVYENQNLPYRYFNVNTGISLVSGSQPSEFNFSNFVTPSVGPINAYFLLSAGSGDLTDRAQIFIGPTSANTSQVGNLSTGTWDNKSPYAQINNMICGNILNADCNDPNIGLLDTRGTFGSYNKNPFAGTAPAFARVNHDILGLSISNKISNNQTTLYTKVTNLSTGAEVVTSQSVQIDINSPAFISSTKSVDKNYATIGDTLQYTFNFVNTGSISANNVVFIDTLPNSVSFVPTSVYINGVNQPSLNPKLPGINLGTIGVSGSVSVTFSASVATIVSPNPAVNSGNITYNYNSIGTVIDTGSYVTNSVTTTINYATLNSSKQVNKNYANIGDILTYTIPISNSGNATANNVVFIDTIPSGTSLVAGSFKQDGSVVSGSPNPSGATLPSSIRPNGVSTVTFQVQILTIPSPNPIPNTASATASFIIDPVTVPTRLGINSTNTNIVNTQVNNANLGNIVKLVDKSYADCADIINYTIVVPNTGNVTAQNIMFKDTIPNGVSFVPDSVYINGNRQTGANPNAGFSVPNIAPGSTTTITFSVKVTC